MNDTGDEEIASNEITSNSGAGIMESERIAFELVNATLTNVGTQTASALISSVTGSNDGGNTEIDNYFLEAEETEKSFSINKSRVELSLEGVLEKVYDATNLGDKELLTYRFVSTNGGASDASIVVEELTYASINVGANILVTAKVRLTSTGNYTLNNSTVSGSIGTITARNITVSLYLKNGKAEKTYDGSNVFATASSTNGDTSVRSEKYKIGFGMTVSDLPTAEISGGVIVNGIFREVLDTRRDLDSYINNVLRSGTENNYRYSMTSGMFKALEFSLDGTRKGNYTFSIDDYSTAETAFDESVILRDSRDTDAGDDSDTSSKIAEINILQKYVNAKYQNAVQSYANDDNSYNTNWVAVTGNVPTVGDDSIQVDVFNGWMFVNGQDGEKKEIKRYTRTQGKVDNSTGLGAKLSSDDGRDLNYKLRNQPVLVVGYFVVPDESDGDAFKIGSLAGLMLASHYYNLSFVENDPDAPLATEEVYVTFTPNDEWKVDGVVYETFELYLDAEQEKLREEYGQDDILIEYFSDMGDSGEYGYYYLKPITMISYVDFKLTDNISGIMSYDDMRILSGEFGDNWGKGNSYLQNFLQTEVGEHVTAVGAVFTENFIGSFNGNGYVIDGMNLVHVGGGNVGMFASVGTGSLPNSEEVKSGSVKELHMRNFNITVYHTSGGSLNVGGIIGHMDSNQPLVELSYHGKIKVTSYVGTVNVGGIIGSVSATESISGLLAKAYVLGNIEVDAMAGNVGGVIGSMQNAGSVSGVVSTIEVFANGSGLSVGALIGQSSDTSVIDSSAVAVYLGNSVWANNSAISKLIGNGATSAGITYDTFRSGSTTGYGTNGYVGVDGGQVAGEYDIMTDYNAGLSAKSRYSTRMIDIFDTYVLGHTTSQIDWVDDPQVKVYQKTNSSVWLGATLGTSADPIVLRYAGQIALLSMFRFATFTLANDIKMPNSYYGTASSGAFYGTVNAGANKIIINSNNTEQTLFENETGNLSDSILKFV